MAKISNEAKKIYFERIAPYKKIINNSLVQESRIEAMLTSSDPGDVYKRLDLAADNLKTISFYVIMNTLSVSLLGMKNDAALNDARKTCYKALINLERVFTNFVDVPFSEYKDALGATASFPELERYALIRKTGLSIALVRDGFGENSRWKWSLVELDGRLAVVAKNTLNLRTLIEGMDPRAEGYRERTEFFNLTWRLLQESADSYRKKYEVSTGRMDDFRIAISYLSVLRRLAATLGRKHQAMDLKRKIEAWKEKMEKDDQVHEEKQRRLRMMDEGRPASEEVGDLENAP